MDTVVFDAARFQAAYPEVQAAPAKLELWFTQAESLLTNSPRSIVRSLKEREMLLRLPDKYRTDDAGRRSTDRF